MNLIVETKKNINNEQEFWIQPFYERYFRLENPIFFEISIQTSRQAEPRSLIGSCAREFHLFDFFFIAPISFLLKDGGIGSLEKYSSDEREEGRENQSQRSRSNHSHRKSRRIEEKSSYRQEFRGKEKLDHLEYLTDGRRVFLRYWRKLRGRIMEKQKIQIPRANRAIRQLRPKRPGRRDGKKWLNREKFGTGSSLKPRKLQR